MTTRRILYCHCAHTQVLPADTKAAVLDALLRAEVAFDAVPDLCAAAARKDPALPTLGGEGDLTIVACFPRAVRWLFHAAGAPLGEGAAIINLREATADAAVAAVLERAG